MIAITTKSCLLGRPWLWDRRKRLSPDKAPNAADRPGPRQAEAVKPATWPKARTPSLPYIP